MIDENNIPGMLKQFKKWDKKTLKVGIIGSEDAETAVYAGANEFGATIKVTKKMRGYMHSIGVHLKASTTKIIIPERSFLRSAFDDKNAIGKVFENAYRIFNIGAKVAMIVDNMGNTMRGEIIKKINSNIRPKNAPLTTQLKGSSKTLVDSGHMSDAIAYEVE